MVIVICMALWISGCTTNQTAQMGKGAASYGLADNKGQIMVLKDKPQRIVSLGIAMDEILVDLVPAQRIAALTYLADDGKISNITAQAKKIPRRATADAEAIIKLQPDLVLVPDWQPVELIQILRDTGIPVYLYKAPKTVREIRDVIAEIAGVVGEAQAGAQIIAEMETKLAAIRAKVSQIPGGRQPVVVRFSTMGVTGGKDSLFDDICRHAGVQNGAALAGLPTNGQLSKEQIVKVNPDVFLIPVADRSGRNADMRQFKADLLADQALQAVTAIQQRRLVTVPDAYMYCSSQYIVNGVYAIAAAAYPQYFGQ
ncbi:corrinoid ABC transporter substrate-binding protein [Methylomusa anaerophila]|uniref:Corrinoid ABC transporter substrate-binding protein n=2 Tax=Methylomusa anaerophila TaxID=1930071 RepID=A0A348AL75_9FIRM|nr:corrinoid ABC transporter substrate-binding protein [Methylomusa anaerophila]